MTEQRRFQAIRKFGAIRGGFSYFLLLSLISFITLLKPGVRGHYRVFTGAARAVWNHEPSYFTDFGWHNGLDWFYSPTCALSFYLPFSFMPETLGVLLSTLIMWAAFIYAVRSLQDAVQLEGPINLFWFLIGSEMIGAITSQKTEILIVAVCLYSTACLLRGRSIIAGLLLALVINWKFQPIPLLGLLVVVEWLYRRNVRLLVSFIGGTILWAVFPLWHLSYNELMGIYTQWFEAVRGQLASEWVSFDHVYNVGRKVLGLPIGLDDTRWIGAIAGAVMLGLQIQIYRRKGDYRESLLSAGAFAAVFMTSFSPLSQSNGYVLIAPTLLLLSFYLKDAVSKRLLHITAALGWILTSMLTSDLVPRFARDYARANAIKSLGPVIILIGIILYTNRDQVLNRKLANTES